MRGPFVVSPWAWGAGRRRGGGLAFPGCARRFWPGAGRVTCVVTWVRFGQASERMPDHDALSGSSCRDAVVVELIVGRARNCLCVAHPLRVFHPW
jgi:hypothetical protein